MERELIKWGNYVSFTVCLIVGILLMVEVGFHLSESNLKFFQSMHKWILAYVATDAFLRLWISKSWKRRFARSLDFVALIPLAGMVWPEFGVLAHPLVVQLILLGIIVGRIPHINDVLRRMKLNPAQIFLLGFVMAIFLGALLLSLPISYSEHQSISFIDAVFMATSAICVTGLVTVDVGTFFSPFGEIVILSMIQLGGLGVMTFYALVALFLNRKFSHKETTEYQESLHSQSVIETSHIFKSIIKFTVLFELIGTLCFFLAWRHDFPTMGDALYASVFHAISSFCNAGISIFSDSLMGFATNPGVILTSALLIFFGGIGFPVIFNLNQYSIKQHKLPRLRVQTKMSLWISVILVVIGMAIIWIGEREGAMASMALPQQALMAFFHSVSARTAGFNAMDLSLSFGSTIWILMILMFIGASPGSTGGGIKTTTIGVLISALWTTMRGQKRIEMFNRTITFENLLKALAILMLAVSIITVFFYALLMTQDIPFVPLLFETISAFGTVGYTLGVTQELNTVGKGLMIVLMFLGRVGSLTFAIALARGKQRANYQYPEERIMLG